jgi:hypothetical protein
MQYEMPREIDDHLFADRFEFIQNRFSPMQVKIAPDML